jgi:mannose-6-phosphate isomerase-like protein (cupin superfamily)
MVGLTSLMLVLSMAAAQAVPPGTYASGADLKKALTDQPAAPMVVARVENTDLTRVNLIHRTVPANAIVHATGWEVHHIVEGRGTVITGGRLVRSVDADGNRVATIADGESRTVGIGDVVIVPAGTPHWYSEIEGSVTYLEIRYDPGTN